MGDFIQIKEEVQEYLYSLRKVEYERLISNNNFDADDPLGGVLGGEEAQKFLNSLRKAESKRLKAKNEELKAEIKKAESKRLKARNEELKAEIKELEASSSPL